MTDDAVLAAVADAAGLGRRGERPRARKLLADLWSSSGGEDGDPLHRCALAHALADVQDDAHDAVAWDLRALAAALSVTDERVARAGMAGPAAALYPSLHLNLADGFRRIGDQDSAWTHVAAGRNSLAALPDDGYRQLIESGMDRISAELGPSHPGR